MAALGGIVLGILAAAPQVAAYAPPGQSSDNATDVILWHGDSANVTIASLQTAMEAGATVISGSMDDLVDAFDDAVTNALTLAFMFSLAVLAYWRWDKPLFLLSGAAFIIRGVAFFTDWYLCVTFVLAGMFLVARAFTDRGVSK